MAELTVAILGLGRLGASVGLALRRYNQRPNPTNHFTMVGHDRLGSAERTAKERGAVDRTETSARAAVRDCDLVILATPYAETRDTLREIGADLRENAVLLDLSPLKLPVLAWAAEMLPDSAHVVGAAAVVNPVYLWDGLDDTDHATADYFDNGSLLLAPAPSANSEAVELVSTLAAILGADVHFIDPAEHDGLAAATEGVPALISAALFRSLHASEAWSEVRRLTNPAFGRVTHRLMDTHPDDLRDMVYQNRGNVVRYLDGVIATLQSLRDALSDDDKDAVEAAFVDAETDYSAWIRQRSRGKWDDALDQPRPENVSLLSGMLGGFLGKRLSGRNSSDDN
jgi:prephenate dehydrogenase